MNNGITSLTGDRTRTHHVKQSKAHKCCMLSLPWSLALNEWVNIKHKETTEAEEEIERERRWGMRKGNRVRKTFHIFYCKNPESLPRRHTHTCTHTMCEGKREAEVGRERGPWGRMAVEWQIPTGYWCPWKHHKIQSFVYKLKRRGNYAWAPGVHFS